MLAGLVVFVLGKSALKGAGEAPAPLSRPREWTLYAVGVGAVAVIWLLVQYQDVIQNLLLVSGILLLGYVVRSEEHTSELQSLMRISYAVFCLTKKHIKYNI